jgi:ABC-type transport system involved in multi-copper enzyme maturation permease subunit
MTFLPVVERELRGAARRSWTHWGRVAYGAGFIFIAFSYLISESRSTRSPAQLSNELFTMLSVFGWFLGLLLGALATADVIASEKREGTLGLLFLTDLRGHDIVLGKMAAAGLGAIFQLVAALPVLALPLLMGGVRPAQFFQVEAVIALGMLYAMSVGMLVSTWGHSARKSYVMAVLWVVLLTVGVVALEGVVIGLRTGRFTGPVVSVVSPMVAFLTCLKAGAAPSNLQFWQSLGSTGLQILLLLLAASYRLPRVWQQKGETVQGMRWRERLARWSLGDPTLRRAYRTALLNRDPICWLDDRYRLLKSILWGVLLLGIVFWMALFTYFPQDMLHPGAVMVTGLIANNGLVIWIALEACQRFAEDRRSCGFELLIGTELTVPEIVGGRLRCLARQFGWAIVAVLAGELIFLSATAWYLQYSLWWGGDDTLLLGAITLSGMLVFLLNCAATAVAGLWYSLTSRNAMLATVKTLAAVVLAHWGIFALLTTGYVILVEGFGIKFFSGSEEEYATLLAWLVPGIVVNLAVGIYCWMRLHRSLRTVVSEPQPFFLFQWLQWLRSEL